MRILTIILGVLLAVGGVYCIMTPISTYSVLSWLIGLAMVVEGIANVITWSERRRAGIADGWTLAGAIVSIVLGCILLVSYVAQFAVDLFIAYMIAAWFIIGGITRIFAAVSLHRYEVETNDTSGSNWIMTLVFGILIIILGVLCFFNPFAVMAGVGMILGISILLMGVGLIVRGATSPAQ